ncbi:hypothetical protein SDC9_44105 [bioreactor metagenome]|uniref:Uncharacterized protein n=1 Tax=bioreactor metagenome TaxID=1076179 RepID=A0A644W2F4_9ZZZZ
MRGTALGIPVVPEVAKITASESSSREVSFTVQAGRAAERDSATTTGTSCSSRAVFSSSRPGATTTAQGSTRSRVPMRDGRPDFAFRGEIAPPRFQAARDRASTRGEFGRSTASLYPARKPTFSRPFVDSSTSRSRSPLVHHFPSHQRQGFSGSRRKLSRTTFSSLTIEFSPFGLFSRVRRNRTYHQRVTEDIVKQKEPSVRKKTRKAPKKQKKRGK